MFRKIRFQLNIDSRNVSARAATAVPLFVALIAAALYPAAVQAQEDPKPKTRAEAIEMQRHEKRARLWPERKDPIAEIVNGFVERGLLDGVGAGRGGGNGFQLALGGMRSGQGVSFGVGYRRSDLFRDRLGFRSTVRGTPQLAWMADLSVYLPQLQTERGFLDVYTKYEYSPQMDYYGEGPKTNLEDITSYSLSDYLLWVRGGWEFHDLFRIGGTAGAYYANTGSGKRGGVPSIEEGFGIPAAEAMGCELPVIATDAGGLPEVVDDGKTGFVVPRGDAQSLADAMRKLLDDEALRQQFGRAGRQKALAEFDWMNTAQSMESLYFSLFEKPALRHA